MAQQAVLRLADLPAGYKATPHDNSSNDKIPAAVAQKFAACAHVPKSEIESFMNGDHKADQPSADSPDFDLTDSSTLSQTSFQNNVEIDRSSKDLSAPLALLGAESAQKCWKDLFQAAFDETAPTGGLVKDLAIIPLPTKSLGDQAAAFEARVTLVERRPHGEGRISTSTSSGGVAPGSRCWRRASVSGCRPCWSSRWCRRSWIGSQAAT